jgi:hypothetical protein
VKGLGLALIASFFLTASSQADSPLTSTDICKAYSQEPIVRLASEAHGLLAVQLMEYLASPGNPIDLKMAVINELGWDINGKANAGLYYSYLEKTFGYANREDMLGKAPADVLLGWAYLKALDNYFNVDDALLIAEQALRKDRRSFTVNIITALIRAQKLINTNWQKMYRTTNAIRKNKSLVQDMKPQAAAIIFEYMDFYKKPYKSAFIK